MELMETFLAQIRDPFRIGLLIALVATMRRTQAATGTLIPLAAGALFVAVIIPMTLAAPGDGGMVTAVGVGLLTNLVLLAVILGVLQLWRRMRGQG